MHREFSSGGIVVRKDKSGAFVLMIKDSYGRWSVPKGHIEVGESSEQAALRETKEETGIDAEIVEKLGNVKYFYKLHGETIFKVVAFYLMRAKSVKLKADKKEVQEARWIPLDEAVNKMAYKNTQDIMVKAVRMARKLS